MHDVIVVGARVAGAATALQFARAGYRVLMVDRARFPSDKLSTLYIHQPGVDRLAHWGVLDTVVATGCPALDRAVYQVADVRLAGCSLPAGDQRAAYAPRRHLLDKILIDAAVAAGVEFREGASVAGPVLDGDRAVGVEFRSERHGRTREHAHLVVGADGMRSTVAKRLGAPHVVEDPLRTCAYYSYWTGLPADFELYERPGNWIGVVPTNDATLIASYSPQADFDVVRADPQAHYLESIRTTAPALYERAMAGEQVDRMHGSGDQQNFFRQASGPGWALVGDAAHHKDSITARGINDAFWQAELLVTAVGDALHDPAALDKRLAVYADDLVDGLFECYRNTLMIGQLEVTDHRLTMLRAVAQSPTLTDRYFATASGVLSVEDFDDDELDEALSA
ncbi:Dehydrogenase (flavoprotein) [Lentzea xinjiangensis]|uniref:Dehydrogenase (Flavoprotein) n=1 Tax=Lentzea xinjiangensis TaxID=402600 RepID=A0A1H9HT48_9PSEU|nr:NAD(P)/FAD-dependent oxidoreductase [Lentzea xinjiangensis]SEQ65432.1 Dehydrogenase (flavoprotein) [Lentzea xinjiangensis]